MSCEDNAGANVVVEETKVASECSEQCQGKEEQPTGVDSGDACTDPNFAGGDQQARFRELCRRTTECKSFFKKLTECNERVNSKNKTDEKCVEEVIDYFHCVDHCAAKRFFKLLK